MREERIMREGEKDGGERRMKGKGMGYRIYPQSKRVIFR
jgi:hypothetical protein